MHKNKNAGNSPNNLERLVPWLPENFWQENFETIGSIFEKLTWHYPNIAVHRLTSADSAHPTEATRRWMWQKFMGGQHGYQRGTEGKVYLPKEDEPIFETDVKALHYGPYDFKDEYLPGRGSYDKAFVLGGFPSQNTNRLMAAVNKLPLEADIDQVIMMAGQRLRWDVPVESSVPQIYKAIRDYSGADMDRLRELSPFVREQEAKSGDGEWNRPYPSEFELARLTAEAVFLEAIDWDDYPVDVVYDNQANPLPYTDAITNESKVFPAREIAMVTYNLKDDRKIHVTNSPAQPRPIGEPKPTSDTTIREAVGKLGIGNDGPESIVIGTSAPHIRAGLDALIRLLQLRGQAIKLVEINSGRFEKGYELITAFGEIPATYKADQRLHAVIRGEDPDSDDLKTL